MRHRKVGRSLKRTSEQKLALMRSLAMALIERGAIETTEARAKELRPFVEKLITKARSGTLHDRRLAGRHIQVRALALDDQLEELGRHRLDVGAVGELRVRHDRRRVRVHEDDVEPLLLEGLRRLRPGIVELRGLADDDRARADEENAMEVSASRHV